MTEGKTLVIGLVILFLIAVGLPAIASPFVTQNNIGYSGYLSFAQNFVANGTSVGLPFPVVCNSYTSLGNALAGTGGSLIGGLLQSIFGSGSNGTNGSVTVQVCKPLISLHVNPISVFGSSVQNYFVNALGAYQLIPALIGVPILIIDVTMIGYGLWKLIFP